MNQTFSILLKTLLKICFITVIILLHFLETDHAKPIQQRGDQSILVVRWPKTTLSASGLAIVLAVMMVVTDLEGRSRGKTLGTTIFFTVFISFALLYPVLLVYGYKYKYTIGEDHIVFRFLWKTHIINFRDIDCFGEDRQGNVIIKMANGRKRKYTVSIWMIGCRELRNVLNNSHVRRKTTLK